MSKSKDKGRYGEHKTVAALQPEVAAERVPLSGSLGGKYSGDVVTTDGRNFRFEVKNRKTIPAYLFDFAKQGSVNAVALTQAGEEVIFILTAEQFKRLYNGPQKAGTTDKLA